MESIIGSNIVVDELTYAVTGQEVELVTTSEVGLHHQLYHQPIVPENHGTVIATTVALPNNLSSSSSTERMIIQNANADPGEAIKERSIVESGGGGGATLYEALMPFTLIPVSPAVQSTVASAAGAHLNHPNTAATTTTTIRWTYASGAQVNPNGGVRHLRPGCVLQSLLAANPMVELDRWCRYTNRYTATCHTCARTFTGVTPKALAIHCRTAKHRTVFEPLPSITTTTTATTAAAAAADLTTSPVTGATSAAAIARLKKLADLVARYPDFGLVNERDLAQNEIFEYELPPEERHLRLNDLYCRLCRRKLVAAQTRYYHRAILDHLKTNKHRREVERTTALALEAAERRAMLLLPPRKISTRVVQDNCKSNNNNKEEIITITTTTDSTDEHPKKRRRTTTTEQRKPRRRRTTAATAREPEQ